MKQRNPNDALFRLIKSMDKGEKRLFNMLSRRQLNIRGKEYLKLFYAIDNQEDYNEFELKKKLGLDKNKFAETKKYLYKLVLDSLAQFQRGGGEKTIPLKVLELEVLLKKKLFDVYELQLYKLRKAAEEDDDYLTVLDTFQREKRLNMLKSNYYDPEKFRDIRKKENHYIELFQEIEDYRHLGNEISFYHTKFITKDTKQFRKISQRPLFKELKKPRTVLAKFYLYNLRNTFYLTLNDGKKAFIEASAIANLIELNPVFSKRNPKFTLLLMMGYIVNCLAVGEYEKALEGVLKYRLLSKQAPEFAKTKELNLYINELMAYKKLGRKVQTLALIQEVKSKMESKRIIAEARFQIAFYLNASFALLDFKEFKRSLTFANNVLNFPDIRNFNFLHFYNAFILRLINLFELNDETLEDQAKAFKRYLLTRGSLNQVEKSFFCFFDDAITYRTDTIKRKTPALFERLKNELELELKNQSEKETMLSYSDLEHWLIDGADSHGRT